MEKTPSDKTLIAALARGDEQAFREVYFRYKDRLWYYCFGWLKSAEDTDDLVQEVFMRLWEMRAFLDPELSFSSFVYTMARNRVLNFFRAMDVEQQVKKALLLKTEEVAAEAADAELLSGEYRQAFRDAIGQLPPQRQRVFNMSRIQHLSHREIAERLGISVYTVQEHISESLHFIKNYIAGRTGLTLGIVIFALYC